MGIFEGLTIIDTYAYYDQPILFTARRFDDSAVLIELLDETDGAETWLSVSLSVARLAKVQSGEIDFHDAFKLAESGACSEWHYRVSGALDWFAPRLCESLTQDDLPMSGASAKGSG